MFLMIDNYDSFVYNLKAYFEELGREIMVRRSDQINIEEIEKMQPEGSFFARTETSMGCCAMCRNSETVSGKDPDLRCLSGTSGVGTLLWSCCREREPSNAWKGDRDPK